MPSGAGKRAVAGLTFAVATAARRAAHGQPTSVGRHGRRWVGPLRGATGTPVCRHPDRGRPASHRSVGGRGVLRAGTLQAPRSGLLQVILCDLSEVARLSHFSAFGPDDAAGRPHHRLRRRAARRALDLEVPDLRSLLPRMGAAERGCGQADSVHIGSAEPLRADRPSRLSGRS
jgi:hypothetical protein